MQGGLASNHLERHPRFFFKASVLICKQQAESSLAAFLFFLQPSPDFSYKVQGLCPALTGDLCCSEAQFDVLLNQIKQV